MNENSPYEQHSYDHYDQAPRARTTRPPNAQPRDVFEGGRFSRLRSPLFATVALLLAGTAFAAIIIFSYPGKNSDDGAIPVIKAETTAFRDVPDDRGGMDVPHRDSTVFTIMRDGKIQDNGKAIENLLAQDDSKETPVDKTAALDSADAEAEASALSTDPTETETADAGPAVDITEPQTANSAAAAAATAEEPAAGEEAKPSSKTEAGETTIPDEDVAAAETDTAATAPGAVKIKQSEEKIPPQALLKDSRKTASATTTTSTDKPPQTLHAAGSSPETIAFVRSVLDQKDAKKSQDAALTAKVAAARKEVTGSATLPTPVKAPTPVMDPARIEPAAGAAITAGNYFAQLGSVKTAEGAATEWPKMQKSFSALNGLEHRVNRVDIPDKGTFFRIQAGPMSKDSAKSVCQSISAQKPGGCLVVQ